MRKLCVPIVLLLMAVFSETGSTAEITSWDVAPAACCDTQAEASCDESSGFGAVCGRGLWCWMGLGPARRTAAVGEFNCSCRGSYKFPVPPQYTYHWPGMYSQQTMTEYSSPWRFPPLQPYRGQSAGRGTSAARLARLPIPPGSNVPEVSKSADREVKRPVDVR